jgi:NADPH2:quinone reductase
MKAVRFHAFGGPEVLRVEELPVPEVGADDVLIKVAAAGVNYADLMRRAGTYQPDLRLPDALGVEAAGTVERVGEKVTGIAPGDRVATFIGQRCQAELVAAPAATLYPLPERLTFEQAGGLPLVGFTAYHLLKTRGAVRPGESVLIQAAASGVGTMAVQMARAWGAKVFATASTEDKLDLARSLGAAETINYARTDFVAEVLGRTGGRGVDLVLECVGGEILQKSFDCLTPGGRLVLYGRASGAFPSLDPERFWPKNITLLTLHLGRPPWTRPMHREAWAAIMGLIASGALRPILDRTFPLNDVAKAHAYLASRSTRGKVVLAP